MVSRDSFKLESCITVQLLITALRYMHTGSSAAAAYLRLYLGEDITERIKAVDSRSPLYDRLQHLLQVIGCADGIYQGEDVAYVNSLLDEVQNFIATNGSDVQALLQYWDDKMSTFAIAGSSSEAIQLMTVHNSKGLEGKTVILLNAAWETEKDHKEAVLCQARSQPAADRRAFGIQHCLHARTRGAACGQLQLAVRGTDTCCRQPACLCVAECQIAP